MTREVADVALVLVSHSRELAQGAAHVAEQMAPGVLVVPAGGTEDGLGTSFDRVEEALGRAADGGRSVVVLADLGSAVLTTEAVLEMADEDLAARVRVADAPFVEGAVAAAVTAHGGGDLAGVLASAQQAGAVFAGSGQGPAPVDPEPAAGEPDLDGAVRGRAVLRNPLGLHARPAAVLARRLAAMDARVTINGVNGASVLELMKLGLVTGDAVEVVARGAAAGDAVALVVGEVEAGFGEV